MYIFKFLDSDHFYDHVPPPFILLLHFLLILLLFISLFSLSLPLKIHQLCPINSASYKG